MEQSEIARLTAELEAVKAERDTARAEQAALIERAAVLCDGAAKYHMSDPDDIDVVRLTAREIRALTPAHAKAALAARDKATRKRALREAADLPTYDWDGDPSNTFENYVFVKRDNIIALMGK